MNSKIAIAVLSASLIAASLNGYAAAASAGFKDLENVPGQAKILALHEKKIVNGVSAVSFAPQSPLTQAEALQLIVKGFKLDEKEQTDALVALNTLFPSVQESAWYANAFGYAHNSGVDIPQNVTPSAKITREQYIDYVMTGLQAVGKMPAIDVAAPDIADLGKVNPAYLDSVQLAVTLGIAKPGPGKKFNPAQPITRAEAAVILYNAVDNLEHADADRDQGGVLPSETTGSGSYASPGNGKFFAVGGLSRALDEHTGENVRYRVSVTLFQDGLPIDAESAAGAAELERLQRLGYDIDYAKAWTYRGDREKADYTYIAAVLTAEQLKSFKASATYGYGFDFASNGDGSAIQGEQGVITAPKTPRPID